MWTFVSRDQEHSPFNLCHEPGRKRWSAALILSGAVHLIAIGLACWPAAPTFVKPNLLAMGEGGSSTPANVALYVPHDIQSATQLAPKLPLPSVHAAEKNKAKPMQRHNVLEQEKSADNRELGSQLGSSADGPVYGDEVKPALPVAFSDPNIPRGDLPSGLQGDVVVEITIDVQGNVSEAKLLQGVGHGIDERVVAAAREWHFHPATRNGVAVLSKQDYRFHFPS